MFLKLSAVLVSFMVLASFVLIGTGENIGAGIAILIISFFIGTKIRKKCSQGSNESVWDDSAIIETTIDDQVTETISDSDNDGGGDDGD